MKRLLITIIVLLVLLIGADRGAHAAAQSRLAGDVQAEEHLTEKPAVDLRGVPFLTQAVRGDYTGARLEIHDLRSQQLLVHLLVINLRDIKIPLTKLASGDVGSVPVGSVSGVALVTYVDLAVATGVPGLVIAAKGDKLELTFPAELFGAGVPVVATARIGVAEQAVRMTSVEIQGVQLPEAVTAAVLGRVQSALAFGVLPYGLKVTGLRVAGSGVEVSASARNTVLHRA